MGNPKVIYRPVIRENGRYTMITYHNTKGKNASFEVGNKAVCDLPTQIARLATGKRPNINPNELQDALDNNLYIGTNHKSGRMADVVAVRNMADKLIIKYSKPDSEGGKMITPNEQYKIMEYWHKWFGNKD